MGDDAEDHPEQDAELETRLARLHRRLGLEGDPLHGPSIRRLSPEVMSLAARGRVDDAAQMHRDQTGCDLATARAAVAALPSP